jgi:tetratricopeptide (TPR) repeat protein
MFRIVPICIASIVVMPLVRCDHDAQDCSQTKAPDAQIKGCSAIINRGTTGKDVVLAYNNRCAAYEIRGDHDRAIADCEQAIKLDPTRARAYAGRGAIYEDKGDRDGAIADYNKAIQLDPKMVAVYAKRGLLYEAKSETDQAIADFDKAIEIDPKAAHIYALRALAYAKKGNKQQVIADLRKALALDPGNEGYKKSLSNLGETP